MAGFTLLPRRGPGGLDRHAGFQQGFSGRPFSAAPTALWPAAFGLRFTDERTTFDTDLVKTLDVDVGNSRVAEPRSPAILSPSNGRTHVDR
jgi:hypothetical protein